MLYVLQICAVLAAVTEVIRSQGGKETETEYFAALVGFKYTPVIYKQFRKTGYRMFCNNML